MSTGEGLGKAMAGMMKQELAGTREGVIGGPEAAPSVVPKSGEMVKMRKLGVVEGQSSQVQPGEVMTGVLVNDLTLGEQVLLGNGNRTSRIQGMRLDGNSVILETMTSTYEIVKA